jgi:hypothetical protein
VRVNGGVVSGGGWCSRQRKEGAAAWVASRGALERMTEERKHKRQRLLEQRYRD